MIFLQRLYINCPRFVKRAAGLLLYFIPREVLYGKKFREMSKIINNTEFLPQKELRQLQFDKLREILEYAYKNVPYYQKLFNEYGTNPMEIDNYEKFLKIPYLTKDKIRSNFNELQSLALPRDKRDYITTGGTSGAPFGFYIDKARSSIEWAFLTSIWRRCGYRLESKRVVLRGEVIKKGRGKLWFYDPLLCKLALSTFHMTDENLWKYVEIINDFKPDFIHGYPSAIYILAMFIKRNNVKLKFRLKGVIGVSESVYESQRKFINDVFKVKMFSHYGQSEKIIYAGECEKSSSYHIEPLYGFGEIINKNGRQVTKDGEEGELVGTGFINHAMPFIRYRTGDMVICGGTKCSCGRNSLLVKEIKGRFQEFIVTEDDSLIPLGPALFGIHDAKWVNIERIQFVQEEKGELLIKIMKAPSISEMEIKDYISNLFKERFEGLFKLEVKFVDDIPLTTAGKHKYLEQHIDMSGRMLFSAMNTRRI